MKHRMTTDYTTDDETQPDENGDTAMSLDTTKADSDEQPGYTDLTDENESAAEPTVDPDRDVDDDQVQPTFTPVSTASANGGPATTAGPDDGNYTRAMPAVTSIADEPVTDLPADEPAAASFTPTGPVTAFPADEQPVATIRADEPAVASTTGNEPLLANVELMRASWQQVQAGFVDDPKAAVSDAADLIDNTVQSLVETLQQRQRQLRDMSGTSAANGESNSAGYGSAASNGVPDTEQLRQVMQRYRSLFNQLVSS